MRFNSRKMRLGSRNFRHFTDTENVSDIFTQLLQNTNKQMLNT